jgi:zinc and cadmium transporter
MPTATLLAYYCLFILLASILGGMIPVWFHITHRWMEVAVSFVAGVMLGVGVLHMLPHAIAGAVAAAGAGSTVDAVTQTMLWLLAGMLVMFFIERFFCFHHHDVPPSPDDATPLDAELHAHDHDQHDHHDLTWSGATLGMVLHSVLAGVALAASVQHGSDGTSLAGFGVFLVIFLHKPFDSMTIGMLMMRGGWSLAWRHVVNGLFSLAIPLGVLVFYCGLMPESAEPVGGSRGLFVAYALAFSAGTFLCISLSDLLPELQFHQHDRVKLSGALLLGLAVAYFSGVFEEKFAPHAHAPLHPPAVSSSSAER